MLEDAVLRL